MKILYLITDGELGGAQKYVLDLAKNFGGIIACSKNNAWLKQESEQNQIDFQTLKFLKRPILVVHDILAFFEILFLIKKIRPDILHLNSSKAGFLGSIAGWLCGVKVLSTAHGFVFNEPHAKSVKKILFLLEKFASIFRDHIITVSEFEKNQAIKARLIAPEKISAIHYGVKDINFLNKNEARWKLKLPLDKFIIGTIANFYHTKGLDVLIDSAILNNNNLIFAVIGDGPERKKIVGSITRNNLINKFLLLGSLKNAASYIPAFDMFVLPSRKEGLPYVLIEALKGSVPIVATNVGGIPELIGQAGIMVESDNPQELADAISKLMDDTEELQRLSKIGRDQSQKFSLETMLHETAQVYEKMLVSVPQRLG